MRPAVTRVDPKSGARAGPTRRTIAPSSRGPAPPRVAPPRSRVPAFAVRGASTYGSARDPSPLRCRGHAGVRCRESARARINPSGGPEHHARVRPASARSLLAALNGGSEEPSPVSVLGARPPHHGDGVGHQAGLRGRTRPTGRRSARRGRSARGSWVGDAPSPCRLRAAVHWASSTAWQRTPVPTTVTSHRSRLRDAHIGGHSLKTWQRGGLDALAYAELRPCAAPGRWYGLPEPTTRRLRGQSRWQ